MYSMISRKLPTVKIVVKFYAVVKIPLLQIYHCGTVRYFNLGHPLYTTKTEDSEVRLLDKLA